MTPTPDQKVETLAERMVLEMFRVLQWSLVDDNHKPYAEGLRPYAAALVQAEEVVAEYRSHGGDGAHDQCPYACHLSAEIDALDAAIRSLENTENTKGEK